MPRKWAAFVFALAASLLLAFAPARSACAEDASDVKHRGDEALVAGRAAEALAAYKQAYEMHPDPALLYNMGRAYQALGDLPSALDELEAFQAAGTPELLAKVPALPGLLAQLRMKVSQLSVTCDTPGASVKLDDRVLGTTPLTNGVRVNAGRGRLEVAKDGYFTWSRDVSLPPGGIATVDVHLGSKETTALLLVKSSVVGAHVAIDGRPEGDVPTEAQLGRGEHKIELTQEGYEPAASTVILAAGEKKTVDLDLKAKAAVYEKWWFWTGIGVVAAGATAVIIALTTEKSPGTGTVAPGRINAGLSF